VTAVDVAVAGVAAAPAPDVEAAKAAVRERCA
jgi:hypothetical protein